MMLNYDETISMLRSISKYGTDWYPDKEQLILFGEYSNYTYNKNRWDNLDLSKAEYVKAIIIKPLENDFYEIIEPTDEEVRAF